MGRTVFFSVIIPTLNEEKFLPRLLTSLSKQTFWDFEVIVADGSSDDKTLKIAQEYKSRLPAITLLAKIRRSLPHQRNQGAHHARGSFFVFMDADVMIPPDYLSQIYQAISEKHAKLLTTWFKPDSSGLIDKCIALIINLILEFNFFIGMPTSFGSATIVSREVFINTHGYNERLPVGEDIDFSIRVAKAGFPLLILKKPRAYMSMRRYHSQGLVRTIIFQLAIGFSIFFHLPLTRPFFRYPMGGQAHTTNNP